MHPTTSGPNDGSSAERVRRRVLIRGRVQGVFFRDATRRRARELGVTGWVRNKADGAVEAVFEGAARAVGDMTAFCRVGPSGASVTAIEVDEEIPQGDTTFEVR